MAEGIENACAVRLKGEKLVFKCYECLLQGYMGIHWEGYVKLGHHILLSLVGKGSQNVVW